MAESAGPRDSRPHRPARPAGRWSRDVSLDVAPGSMHLLVGPNGAGKSTLLAAVLGLIEFTGSIRFHWRGSGRIGYVPQSFHRRPHAAADRRRVSRPAAPAPAGLLRHRPRRCARGWTGCSHGSASPASPRGRSARCRAASCSASCSPTRSIRCRSCCCSTSRRAGSTRRRCSSSRTSCSALRAAAGHRRADGLARPGAGAAPRRSRDAARPRGAQQRPAGECSPTTSPASLVAGAGTRCR